MNYKASARNSMPRLPIRYSLLTWLQSRLSHGLIRIVPSAILSLAIAGLAALSVQASTFTVINTNDSGAGSLRQAIVDANAHPGFDEVKFDIPGLGGVRTITLASSLPWITDPITI